MAEDVTIVTCLFNDLANFPAKRLTYSRLENVHLQLQCIEIWLCLLSSDGVNDATLHFPISRSRSLVDSPCNVHPAYQTRVSKTRGLVPILILGLNLRNLLIWYPYFALYGKSEKRRHLLASLLQVRPLRSRVSNRGWKRRKWNEPLNRY